MTERADSGRHALASAAPSPLMSRRSLLKRVTGLVGAAAGVALFGRASATKPAGGNASGIVAKQAVQYRDQPNGNSACANCANFIAGKDADAVGRCLIVAGNIRPEGWCLAYAGNA